MWKYDSYISLKVKGDHLCWFKRGLTPSMCYTNNLCYEKLCCLVTWPFHNVLGCLNLYNRKQRTHPLLSCTGTLSSHTLLDWCERTDRFIERIFARSSPSGLNRPAQYSEQQGQCTEMMIVDIYRAPVKTHTQTGLGLWAWTHNNWPFATQSIL